jgi:hypothetical protein
MSDAISLCFKGWRQFSFEIALLSWGEQIHFITSSPNTLGNNLLAVIYSGRQGLLQVHNDGTQKLLSNHGFTTFSHQEHIPTKFLIISVVLRF